MPEIGPRRGRRGPWGELVVTGRDAALAGGAPIEGDVAAIVVASDEAEGRETAEVMLHRAGRPLRVVLAHGCAPEEAGAVANALARRSRARVLALVRAPAFAAEGWLARAGAALEGHVAVAPESGSGAPAGVVLDGGWAAGRPAGAVLRPDLPMTPALTELIEAARAEGGLAHDPAAVLLNLGAPDEAPGAGEVTVLDAREARDLDPGEPEVTAVVMPCLDPDRGRAAAARLTARAGAPLRVLIAVDAGRRGFVATLNAVAGRLAARNLVYLAEDAVPGRGWLARGLAALDAPGTRLVGLNCGKWDGRIAAFGLMRLDWARGLYDGRVMHPRYRAHRADNELTAIARARGAYAYAPSALLVERDPRKAVRAGEREAANFDPADRRRFRRRFMRAFGGLAPRAPLAALADDYFAPEPAAEVRAALEASGD